MNTFTNIIKKGLFLSVLFLMIFHFTNKHSYANKYEINNTNSDQFTNFINQASYNIDNMYVINKDGREVSDYFKNETEVFFQNKDYNKIKDLIIGEDLTLYIENNNANKNGTVLLGSSRTQLYSKVINQSYNLQGQRQTWKVILSGTITYNANTGKIYSASTPSLSLYDVSGIHENYDARLTKVTTSGRI